MTVYRLQESYGGEAWKDVEDYPRDASDLAAWIKLGNDCDTYGGKYEYRIIDDQGAEVWHIVEPYEGVRINLLDEPGGWLKEIQRDYGINDEIFKSACESWLAVHHD